MTKQTVYLNNIARKSGCRLQNQAVCLLNSPLLERSDQAKFYKSEGDQVTFNVVLMGFFPFPSYLHCTDHLQNNFKDFKWYYINSNAFIIPALFMCV